MVFVRFGKFCVVAHEFLVFAKSSLDARVLFFFVIIVVFFSCLTPVFHYMYVGVAAICQYFTFDSFGLFFRFSVDLRLVNHRVVLSVVVGVRTTILKLVKLLFKGLVFFKID